MSDSMKNPVISVVIPVYGVEKYIEEFADSLFSQGYPYVQYVFVNDGTKDNSIGILNQVIDSRYPELREKILIVNKENGGLPAARKTGMDYVTGDYVCHMDPDDWISPDSFQKMAEVIESSQPDLLYYYYAKEYPKRSSVKKDINYADDIRSYISDMYNHKAAGTLCNKCVKTSLYRDNDISFPPYSYAEDCYVSCQLAAASHRVVQMEYVVYHYRKNNTTSISHQNIRKRKKEYCLNFLDLYEKYREVPEPKNLISCIFDDILIQAGYHSILYNLDLFSQFDYLAAGIRKAKMRFGTDVPIFAQLIVKLVALFK